MSEMHELTQMTVDKTSRDYYKRLHAEWHICPRCNQRIKRYSNLLGNRNAMFCVGDRQFKGQKPTLSDASLRRYHGV